MRILSLVLLGLLALPASAEAQRRAMTTLNAQEGAERFSCRVAAVQMTAEGLGFSCWRMDNSSSNYIIAFDGGTRPGGISAAMSLLTSHMEMSEHTSDFIVIRAREPGARAQAICTAITADLPNPPPCREAVMISVPNE